VAIKGLKTAVVIGCCDKDAFKDSVTLKYPHFCISSITFSELCYVPMIYVRMLFIVSW